MLDLWVIVFVCWLFVCTNDWKKNIPSPEVLYFLFNFRWVNESVHYLSKNKKTKPADRNAYRLHIFFSTLFFFHSLEDCMHRNHNHIWFTRIHHSKHAINDMTGSQFSWKHFFGISFQEIENVRSSFFTPFYRTFFCFKQEKKIKQHDAAHKRLLTCE